MNYAMKRATSVPRKKIWFFVGIVRGILISKKNSVSAGRSEKYLSPKSVNVPVLLLPKNKRLEQRSLSNRLEVLVRGVRCPQVGRITMDMSLVDVTVLRGRVQLGDEMILIGRQGEEEIRADGLAKKLGTINYEVVTSISHRVPRVAVGADASL
jgi:hypothetical protein